MYATCLKMIWSWICDYVLIVMQECYWCVDVNCYSKLCWLILFCYEFSPLLLELPPCGQVQVIVLSVQVVREWPYLTVLSRSLWYVTGWGCLMHASFFTCIWCSLLTFEIFYGACVPNVYEFLVIIPLQSFEVNWLNKLLFNCFGLCFM